MDLANLHKRADFRISIPCHCLLGKPESIGAAGPAYVTWADIKLPDRSSGIYWMVYGWKEFDT